MINYVSLIFLRLKDLDAFCLDSAPLTNYHGRFRKFAGSWWPTTRSTSAGSFISAIRRFVSFRQACVAVTAG